VVAAVERERVGTSGNRAKWAETSHETSLPTFPSPVYSPCFGGLAEIAFSADASARSTLRLADQVEARREKLQLNYRAINTNSLTR